MKLRSQIVFLLPIILILSNNGVSCECGYLRKMIEKLTGLDLECAEESRHSTRAQDFRFEQCSDSEPDIKIVELEVSPTIINIKGNLQIKFLIDVKQELSAPVKIDVKIYKKTIFGEIKIPCVKNVGSCTYELCEILEDNKDFCKESIIGGDECECPVEAGSYESNTLDFNINDLAENIPEWMASGDYKATVTVKQGDQELTCYNVYASII